MATPKPNPIGALTGANDGLADGIITHAVNLERLKASEVQQISAMLRTLQGQLLEQLNSLDPTAVGGKTRANRLLRLFKNVQATIRANYSIIQKHHGETLTNVAELEGKMLQNAVGQGVAGAPKVGVALMNTLHLTPHNNVARAGKQHPNYGCYPKRTLGAASGRPAATVPRPNARGHSSWGRRARPYAACTWFAGK